MRKMTLKEELERIHSLTYGEKVISENGFLDKILHFGEYVKDQVRKFDDPKKADYVSNDVGDFFETLEGIDSNIYQQKLGSMEYQKEVETTQIGLILLGYQLPKHGVDGLFGPETATAVNQFKKDNDISNSLNESTLEAPIQSLTVTQPFGVHNSHESSHPGVDLRAMSGTKVKSPANGTITNAEFSNGACGGTVTIKHGDNFQSRYCHLKEINVTKGQTVSQGDLIGVSGGNKGDKGAGNSVNAHLHFELKKDNQLVDPLDYVNKEGLNLDTMINITKSVITPTLIKVLIDKLRTKGITPDDLSKYIDVVKTGGADNLTDLDLTTKDGYDQYSQICQTYLNSVNPSAGISGDMLAYGAKQAYYEYHKYVPPELALSQLTIEGGLSKDPNDKPIRTKNPFNVGNTETGTKEFPTIQSAINSYYLLIARSYIGKGKTASDLFKNFVNKDNERYATETNYENEISKIANRVNKISKQIIDQNKTNG
jgi:hypothetical protein